MKPIEQVSRQRIAQIRNHILRDVIKWTLGEPHRIMQFTKIWNMFHWLVYKREQNMRNGMKLCTRCQKIGRECWYPIDQFGKNSSTKDSISSWCIFCMREINADYRNENRSEINKYRKNFEKNHPDLIKQYRKKSYIKHRKKRIQESRTWQKNNSKRWNAYNRKRYAQRKERREA